MAKSIYLINPKEIALGYFDLEVSGQVNGKLLALIAELMTTALAVGASWS